MIPQPARDQMLASPGTGCLKTQHSAGALNTKYLYRPIAHLFTGSPGLTNTDPKIFVGILQNKYLVFGKII